MPSAAGSATTVKAKAVNKDGAEVEREYHVAAMGPKVRAFFVQLLKRRAWKEVDDARQVVDPERWRRMEDCVTLAMTAGKYEWGDEIHNGMLETRTGYVLDFLSRLKPMYPDAAEADVIAIVEAHGWDKVFRLSALADGIPLPKGTGPESGPETPTTTNEPSGTSSPGTPEPQSPKSST